MLLSDRDIRAAVEAGRIGLDPYDPALVQPSSIDVRLGGQLRVFDPRPLGGNEVDLRCPIPPGLTIPAKANGFRLFPGEFVLASTAERLTLGDDVAARLEGKALALQTPIPTPAGWTTMSELQPGDEVIGGDGRPVAVIAATDILHGRDCFEITFSNGERIVADAQHQWLVESRKRGGLHLPAVRTTEHLSRSVRSSGMLRHWVRLVATIGRETALPIDPYVLGVWLGDGDTAGSCVTFNERDFDDLRAEVGRRGVAVTVPSSARSRSGAVRCRLGRDPRGYRGEHATLSLQSRLRSLGVIGDKHIPPIYLRASWAQRWDLLKGLLDTDGYVNERGDQAELTLTCERLASGVGELVASLGLAATSDARPARLNGRTHGMAYRLRFRPTPSMFVTAHRATRARDTEAWERSVFTPLVSIKAIERVPSVPVRCIQVANADGIFLAGRKFTPTHNSSLARLGLQVHSTAGYIDPGFTGDITLELSNVGPLVLTLAAGMLVGQLVFEAMSSQVDRPYGSEGLGSHYQGQHGPTEARSSR